MTTRYDSWMLIRLSLKRNAKLWLLCCAKLIVVIASTIGFVENALTRSCVCHQDSCHFLRITSKPPGRMIYVPNSVLWLGQFLSTQESANSNPWVSSIHVQPRWLWLLYWSISLLFILPMAAFFAVKLKHIENAIDKRRLTVVARKFFHFVAIVLFLPPTLVSPSMMALSYAVAAALLILIESLRVTVNLRDFIRTESVPSNGGSCRFGFWNIGLSVNDFYAAYFDEKDVSGKKGGFVVTHAALVCGCAAPLWLREILIQPPCHQCLHEMNASFEVSRRDEIFDRLLPLVGVLALGVGDAAGALIGIFFGKTKWPGTRRTVEGTIAMFLSMFIFVFLFCVENWFNDMYETIRLILLLVALTAIEAFTAQIDNICLPLAGAAIIMIGCIDKAPLAI